MESRRRTYQPKESSRQTSPVIYDFIQRLGGTLGNRIYTIPNQDRISIGIHNSRWNLHHVNRSCILHLGGLRRNDRIEVSGTTFTSLVTPIIITSLSQADMDFCMEVFDNFETDDTSLNRAISRAVAKPIFGTFFNGFFPQFLDLSSIRNGEDEYFFVRPANNFPTFSTNGDRLLGLNVTQIKINGVEVEGATH